MQSRIGSVAIAFGLLIPGWAAAHHSLALYSNEIIVLEGEIVDIAWQNPHVMLELRTTGADGHLQTWRMEGGSLATLQRSGVTRDIVHVGDRVKVAGRESRGEPFVLGVTNMLLPDGREAQLLTGAPARFNTGADRLIRGADRVVANARQENRGIFRVWSVPSPNPVGAAVLQALPFTAAAVGARKSFDLLDNFATRCEPEGMPRLMFNPHPFEFIDRGTTIALRAELYDTERTIHMNVAAPSGEPNFRLGYSVGRWDGNELVVTTTHVSWPFFDNIGSPQSPAVEIVERFGVNDDQTELTFRVTVTEPATFTAPAVVGGRWLALGDTISRYDCQVQPRQ